jgi:hypothetical protein
MQVARPFERRLNIWQRGLQDIYNGTYCLSQLSQAVSIRSHSCMSDNSCQGRLLFIKVEHTAQAVAVMKQLEALVDVIEAESVRDVLFTVQFSLHHTVHQAWHLVPALPSTERSAAPHTTGHQLERPSGNLSPACGNTDDHGFTPACDPETDRQIQTNIYERNERMIDRWYPIDQYKGICVYKTYGAWKQQQRIARSIMTAFDQFTPTTRSIVNKHTSTHTQYCSPLWQHSSAERITSTFPMHSNE